jgi:chromatin remodeling complex protein RSC6
MSAKVASNKSAKSASAATEATPAKAAPAKKVAAEKPAEAAAPAPKKQKKAAASEASAVPSEAPAKAPRASKAKQSSVASSVVAEALNGASSSDADKPRRVVNNEEVEKNFDELAASVEAELQALRDDKNHTVGIRFLRSVCRQLKSLKADSLRLLTRKVKKPTTRNGNSGFMKPVKITSEMAKFCGFTADQLVSRVDVTKAICNYVKEKNLQNQTDRRQFTPDAKLSALLGVTDTITYYTLQKYIQKHFVKEAKPKTA